MAEDRSWMYAGRPSRRRITPEWAEKATEFVERAFRRAPPGRVVPCPCARCRCRNRLPRSKFDMQIHLGREGFMPDYTVWVHHGESRTATAKPSDDLPEDNDNQVAAGAGDAVSKPQGAKTKKRTISDIEAYAVARQLSEEDRIEWKRQMYLWEMKKLQQQQQQNAPKRLRTSGAPPAELDQVEGNKDVESCASSSGSI